MAKPREGGVATVRGINRPKAKAKATAPKRLAPLPKRLAPLPKRERRCSPAAVRAATASHGLQLIITQGDSGH
jgi:hypothetical protein